MIFQIFNKITLNIQKNFIKIDTINFFNQDKEIQNKIIDIIYKYLMPNRSPARYKKILLIINILVIKSNIITNLGGMDVKKDRFSIKFSN